jgi:hypothetical protein
MGGSGFAIDMIRKAKANRALRKERINRYREKSSRLRKGKGKVKTRTEKRQFKSYSTKERQLMKSEIRRVRQKKSLKSWGWSLVLSFILTGLVYWLFKTIATAVG